VAWLLVAAIGLAATKWLRLAMAGGLTLARLFRDGGFLRLGCFGLALAVGFGFG
jgi:hypothetical protein